MDKTQNKTSIPRFVKKAVCVASLGGILFGYDFAVISAALPQLTNEFELSKTQQEMLVSFLFLGGTIGAAIGGTICDTSGRKKTIIYTDIMFILGAIILFLAPSFTIVLLGRLVVGFAVAVSGIADVAYLHEISPVEYRGAIVSVNEACISLGFLISYVVGYAISQVNDNDGWRYMFGLGSIIGVIQLVGMLFMPESPVWLRGKGKFEEAEVAMQLISSDTDSSISSTDVNHGHHQSLENDINGNSRINQAIEDYGFSYDNDNNNDVRGDDSGGGEGDSDSSIRSNKPLQQCSPHHNDEQNQKQYSSFNIQHHHSFENEMTTTLTHNHDNENVASNMEDVKALFRASYRQLIIAIFLSVMQQFCGHPNVLNFAPEIFEQIGVPSLSSTLLVGTVKFLVTCFVIWKIEEFGRRFLLMFGMSIIAISLLFVSIAYSIEAEEENMSLSVKIVAVIGVCGVATGYACSFGPLTWLLVSELFPSSVRGRALGASTIISYLAGALVSFTFLSGQSMFGEAVPFFIYFVLTFLSIGFVFVAIPDTAGKDPLSIQDEIIQMWFWRDRNKTHYVQESRIDMNHQVV